MPDEVVQGTSPLISGPETLSSDALQPASADDIFAALDAIPAQPAATTATRRRGRPPGSRNKTAAQKLAEINPEAAQAAEDEAKRAAKKKRVEEIEGTIYGELNDQLMSILVTAFNIPPDFIYKDGAVPIQAKKDTRFTDFGNRLAIPPNLAHSIGKLAAELEGTGVGKSVTGITQNSNAGLVVAAGMTIFGVIQYANTLKDTFEKVRPLIEARQRWLEEEAEKQVANAKHAAPANDSVVSNSGSVS